jgi:multiple sugar transport system substrate-binding protein
MLNHFKLIPILFVGLLSTVAGCSGASENKAEKSANNPSSLAQSEVQPAAREPVTITMFQYLSQISDVEFNELIAKPVKEKYPNITMKLTRLNQVKNLSNLIASGDFPDIIFAGALDVNAFLKLKVLEDLSPMIKANQMDLNRFDQAGMQMLRSYDSSGKIVALPYSLGYSALFYNKDLFNKFAIPFPTDGMSWEQTTALARMLTREEGGTQYGGLGMMAASRFAVANFQSNFDSKTRKAVFTTDEWKKTVETYLGITGIPGNSEKNTSRDAFLQGTVAMRADLNPLTDQLGELYRTGKPINWDFVSFPTPTWRPGVVDTPLQILMMSSLSKHKKEVFQIMELLTSNDMQIKMTKTGRLSALNNPQLHQVFGQDLEYLKGKNIASLFKNTNKPQPLNSIYNDILVKHFNRAITKLNQDQTDINTALRQAEEQANIEISANPQ